MAGIQRRVIFFDDTGGFVRFRDWARCTTELGMMHEPFIVNTRHSPNEDLDDFDPEDMMARIDGIERIDATIEARIYSSGVDNPPTMGGAVMPRVGK